MEPRADITLTLDEKGSVSFDYHPESPGFNSFAFVKAIEALGGKIEDAQWYMCG